VIVINEQEQFFLQLLNRLKSIKTNIATKEDVQTMNIKLDNLTEKLDSFQFENINADNI